MLRRIVGCSSELLDEALSKVTLTVLVMFCENKTLGYSA